MKKMTMLFIVILIAAVLPFQATAAVRGRFTASFLQGWLCRYWSAERWDQEFKAMQDVGFDSVIIQSMIDLSDYVQNKSGHEKDYMTYTPNSKYANYPTRLISGLENTHDALRICLESAKKYGMKVIIGTVYDEFWWKFGWGIPETMANGTSYFEQYLNINGKLCGDVIEEVWERYKTEFSEQIAAFYYVNELWNFDVACAGNDNKLYAKLISKNIEATIHAVNKKCPGKPLLISPFYNPSISTAEQYKNFWIDIYANTAFRYGDIFAHQDGAGHEQTTEVIKQWAIALQEAAKTKNGIRFWINNENFYQNGTSRPVSELKEHYEATKFAEKHIIFSWNHYYNKLYKPEFAELSKDFAEWGI